jgi:hypothetical protein
MTTQFDLMKHAIPVSEFPFAGNQAKHAAATGSVLAFNYRYLAGNIRALPLYIWRAAAENGYTIVHLGGATYKHSVLGLVPIPELQ